MKHVCVLGVSADEHRLPIAVLWDFDAAFLWRLHAFLFQAKRCVGIVGAVVAVIRRFVLRDIRRCADRRRIAPSVLGQQQADARPRSLGRARQVVGVSRNPRHHDVQHLHRESVRERHAGLGEQEKRKLVQRVEAALAPAGFLRSLAARICRCWPDGPAAAPDSAMLAGWRAAAWVLTGEAAAATHRLRRRPGRLQSWRATETERRRAAEPAGRSCCAQLCSAIGLHRVVRCMPCKRTSSQTKTGGFWGWAFSCANEEQQAVGAGVSISSAKRLCLSRSAPSCGGGGVAMAGDGRGTLWAMVTSGPQTNLQTGQEGQVGLSKLLCVEQARKPRRRLECGHSMGAWTNKEKQIEEQLCKQKYMLRDSALAE